ncbi:putative DNA helicase [Cotesia vestalis bracovirus]|nr:putative DNA helicase [Cotesia vestalis bracovirus]
MQNRRANNRGQQIDNLRRRTRYLSSADLNRAAFQYDCSNDYSLHPSVCIGQMDVVCEYCGALKFSGETPGLCCLNGKVKLPLLTPPPEPLYSLLCGETQESRHFLANTQKYNGCFQMTSFGADIIEERGFNPTFKIQGQIHHRIGSLLPFEDTQNKFLQIYFMGNMEEQLDRRLEINAGMKRAILQDLQCLLHEHHALVRLFKSALERMPSDDYKVVIKADKRPSGTHERTFNAPTVDEVAILIVGEQLEKRDIVLTRRDTGQLQQISETHRSYDTLQYPLMFWQGEDGYYFNIKMKNPLNGEETTKKVSSMNYYAYRLMIRQNADNYLLRFRRLFQQYCVDMYVKIETERLTFIRLNQAKLRSEEYIHLRDAVNTEGNAANIGRLTILPATYIGSPRHMHEYAQDAMTYVRHYGRPDLFITFTCNPKWIEITQLLLPGQTSSDRHDITARIFRQKIRSLMNFIVKQRVFGDTRCWMYSIEWQKRGLPHAHILIWLVERIQPDQIDDIICAEIPDYEVDPDLHDVVTTNMIHGPCGAINPQSPCMVDGKCSKRYPRKLTAETVTGNDGYPLYRRRSPDDNGRTVTTKVKRMDFVVDNSWIVPYSPLISKSFKTHCNVEYCNSVKSIKYICKYVTKGSDMAVFGLQSSNTNDEISRYQVGRYVNCNEAIWRIFAFPIHERHPTVTHLAVHLENGQRVYFTASNATQRAETPPATTLTSFFAICQSDQFARTLLYSEMPRYYTWNASSKNFQRRKQGDAVPGYPDVRSTDALGRMYTVHPKNNECFYLRLLLVNVRGPTSFESLRTVNGVIFPTYRAACEELKLLENDSHWDTTIAEAIICASPSQIRTLFAIIISTCFPSNPCNLWHKYKDNMSEDILHQIRVSSRNHDIEMNEEIHNRALLLIEDMCYLMCGNLLIRLGMPAPYREMNDAFNRELEREREYDHQELDLVVQTNVPLLNYQQKKVYDTLMKAIDDENGGLYFLDAPGGTGKTFLMSLVLATVRARSNIAVAVASSGIAATLLEGCPMAKVLAVSKIIIWDECTMAHKRALEALNRTLKDLRNDSRCFGGAMILLSGDFRQILPVIPRSTAADEINACLKSSNLWRHVKKLQLTTNMRVALLNDTSAEDFSEQLLTIGNGQVPVDESSGLISFPNNFCNFVSSKDELINNVFPEIISNYKNYEWMSERAILAAKNKDVDDLNNIIQNKIIGTMHSFKSIDCVTNEDEATNYPIEFLNSLDVPGLPPHNLRLKVGSVVIMLRNINQPKLCNGTRLVVRKLMNNVIYATIMIGKFKGEQVLIPRIPMIPTDMPFEFKRLQFPIRLAFAMTINKSQGQSLKVCGLNLEHSCFSHGQLYVACSRVGRPSALFVFAPDNKTKNVVYHKVLK